MINKEIYEITLADLEDLISNAVPEGKTIEYKEELKLLKDGEKKEFLYDIASFANASGGDLIFGIKQNKVSGYPETVKGIEVGNKDQLQLQLDSMIRSSILPRLPSIKYRFVPLKDDFYVLIIRISKSWYKPHQVTYQRTDKFYSRSTNGKYILDVFELRNAFIASDSLKQSILKFRIERVSDVVSNESVVSLLNNGKIILHVIPFLSFETGNIYDLNNIVDNKQDLLRPIGDQACLTRLNFDGILSYANYTSTKPCYSYMQLYKNGIIETVDSWVIQPFKEGEKLLYIDSIEEFIIHFLYRATHIYKHLNITSPFILLLTMTGTRGFRFGSHSLVSMLQNVEIDKDTMIFPDILIEDWASLDMKVKPWFDSLWNSVGISESRNYKDGKWFKRH